MRTTERTVRNAILILALLIVGPLPARAALTVTVSVDPSPVQLAGRPVVLTAVPQGASESSVFQFAFREYLGTWRVIRDFYYVDRLDWVTLKPGLFELKVVARINTTGETAEDTAFIAIGSLGRTNPTLSQTAHPLVALYSAPPCAAGQMLVRFRRLEATVWQYTTAKACTPGQALNFYVAGLRANWSYVIQHQVITGSQNQFGPEMTWHTGPPGAPLPSITVEIPAGASTSFLDSVVLQSIIGNTPDVFPVASDLSGGMIWYYAVPGTTLTRPVFGGSMLVLIRDDVSGRILREIDPAGWVVRETNSTEVSRQLVALGHDPIGVFHHEAIRLANGHTLAIASVERILVDEQGPGPVHVYGEMIVDLDENLQVAWAWNAFDHLDRSRLAILGETCTFEGPGCPALFLGPLANDWLHANAIGYVPDDGNLLLSLRHQDWVIKIDYRNGQGSGAVLWKLGTDGDFALASMDPSPWFSHQHDAKMANGRLLLYDNGNTRVQMSGGGNSRGQVYVLNEGSMIATLQINLDLGVYAAALGSSEPLLNGNFHFDNGFLGTPPNPSGQALEVTTDGTPAYAIRVPAFVYRSFRMTDLYRP